MVLKCGVIFLSIYILLPQTFGELWLPDVFVEFEAVSYEDACVKNAKAEWRFINDPTNRNLLAWKEERAAYSLFMKNEVAYMHNETIEDSDNESITYQISILEKPGDTLLNETEWRKLVNFSAEAAVLRTGVTNGTLSHPRRETELFLAGNAKLDEKRSRWSNWHRRLLPLAEKFSSTLGLVSEAAKANGAESVEEYWQLLSGYSNGYDRMKMMWEEITELHKKLVNFVRNRLAKKYKITSTNDAVPAYLLGSLEGSDWISIATDVLPYGNVTYSLMKNLWEKNLRGVTLYRIASKMGKSILKEVPDADFWKESIFNQTCSTQLVNFCLNGATRVLTCHQASLTNFLTAHKVVAEVATSQMIRDKFPVFNTANRYSGLNEAVSELFSILSVSPGELVALGLIDNSTDTEHSKISSLMITALDVLPRLGYYISADLWRIDAIRNGTTSSDKLLQSWWQYRQHYQGVTSDSLDIPTFLDDELIPSNKPYLPKFVGTVLAFQLYEHLTNSMDVRYDAATKYQVNRPLIAMLQEGGSDDWSKVLNAKLNIDEVATTALRGFFSPLENYLDAKLEEDIFPLTSSQEADLHRLVELFESRDVTTTPPPAVTAIPTLMPKTTKIPPKNASSSISISPPVITPEKPVHEGASKTVKKVDVPLQATEKPAEENVNYTDKISTSKAVWAVAIVLVATITICIIAIFGRRRCVKSQTPKNRR